MPHEGLVRIDVDEDYYDVQLFIHVLVDRETRSVNVGRLWCRSRDWWPKLKYGEGGIGWYKKQKQKQNLPDYKLSFVDTFFGPGWVAGELPLTRPRVTPEEISACHELADRKREERCPWDKVVATYFKDRTDAATIIQKRYRGWKVRLATTFNPNTPLGRFNALRSCKDELSVV